MGWGLGMRTWRELGLLAYLTRGSRRRRQHQYNGPGDRSTKCPLTDHALTVRHAANRAESATRRVGLNFTIAVILLVALLLVSAQPIIPRGVTADFETHYRGTTVAVLPIPAVLPHHFLILFPSPQVLPR